MSKQTELGALGSPEIELLRSLVDPARKPVVSAVQGRDVDWGCCLRALKRHGLGPLAHRRLSGAASCAVPQAVAESLEHVANLELAKAIVRLHHLDEIATRASASKRPICLLKGMAFATALYEHPAERPMTDIDLLVEPSSLESWATELESLGYELQDASDHALSFRQCQSGVSVELHRALTSCSRALGLDARVLFERAGSATTFPDNVFVKTLRWEDHLLHLCLHASFQHGFRQPAINAWDARLVSARPELDWDAFRDVATEKRIATWVYGGLVMSHAVFPGDSLARAIALVEDVVPPRVRRKASRTIQAGRLLSTSREAVFGTPFRRLTWENNPLKTLVLLFEVSRSRGSREKNLHGPSPKRVWQLLHNHGITRLNSTLFQRFRTPLGPTPASLGEIRDV